MCRSHVRATQSIARQPAEEPFMSSEIRRTARAHTPPVARRRGLALVALAALIAPAAASAAGDAVHGAQVYKTCGICQSLDKNGQGPRHAGVFGRAAGSVPDYQYSPALKKSGIVWNEATLDKWLTDPSVLVPGTKMFYRLKSAQDRADVIEYLKDNGVLPKTNTPTP
jgi:cytochrome c